MTILSFIKKLLTGLYNSIRRFPVTIAFSAVVAIMGIVQLHWDNISESPRTFLTRLQMTLAMGIPLSLSIRIFFERFRIIKSYFKALTYLAGAVSLTLYYFILLKEINLVSGIRYAAVNIALYPRELWYQWKPPGKGRSRKSKRFTHKILRTGHRWDDTYTKSAGERSWVISFNQYPWSSNISPARDDGPYFFNFFRFGQIPDIIKYFISSHTYRKFEYI